MAKKYVGEHKIECTATVEYNGDWGYSIHIVDPAGVSIYEDESLDIEDIATVVDKEYAKKRKLQQIAELERKLAEMKEEVNK